MKKKLQTLLCCFFIFVPVLSEDGNMSPCFSNGVYLNDSTEDTSKFAKASALIFGHTLLSRAKNLLSKGRVYPSIDEKTHWIENNTIVVDKSEKPIVTWIGHATFLIQIGGVNILTDPVYGDLHKIMYQRILPEGIPFEKLPKIDFVLISHNHRDHMDEKTLSRLKRNYNPTILVPEGNKTWFKESGFEKVFEYTWWKKHKVSFCGVEFTCLPARHWSVRNIRRNETLWCSWMISHNYRNIYFAGDTAYGKHFATIKNEFNRIDVSLLPVAPCKPRELLKDHHMDPIDAGRAFIDLGARHFFPMHWGTFGFGSDYFDDPIILLKKWSQANEIHLLGKTIHYAKVGQEIRLD
ncbi:hypothetical protein HN446_04510 [bacterium]|jgi:L-ascorbate metabolism protein UlaG (beta-lactamase superfamily)|nr:hypothetical protein [bacterium]